MKMKELENSPVVLTGGTGRLGRSILLMYPHTIAPTRKELEITNYQNVYDFLHALTPKVVIHSAALVGKRECENQPKLARKINILGTQHIVSACEKIGTKLVYVSSCAVFDGKKGNYLEKDIPNPQYLYAETKLEAETIVSKLKDHLIIRTDFFDPYKFKYNNVLADHFCSKEPTTLIAKKILMAIQKKAKGILHIGGARRTLYDILKPFFPNIKPITTIESNMPNFPKDLSLCTNLFDNNCNVSN